MAMPVTLQDVIEALECAGDEITAYINHRTGEVIILSNEDISSVEDSDDENFTVPEWQAEMVELAEKVLSDDDFIELPGRFDIHEYAIMERFCWSLEDERMQETLLRAISGRGAFRRFKDLIFGMGIARDWFAFRDEAFKRTAVDFLESRQISYTDGQS